MGLMQSGSNFTDRIVKYVAKRAERKTKPASPPMGHVIPQAQVALIAAFSSSVLFDWMLLIFLLTIPIDSLWGSGQARWLANQAQ